ncbi:MAG: efflux RND transporter periplasmic adaptor subunit [Chloroflexota bacterium]
MKFWKNRVIKSVLVLVALLLVTANAASCTGRADDVQRQFVDVKRGDIEVTVAADGNLSLIRDRKLTFGTSGTISEINVEEGDMVTEGQMIARLDTESLELAINTAELAVKVATLDLEIATDAYKKITYPYTYYTFALGIPESVAAIAEAQLALDSARQEVTVGLDAAQYTEITSQLQKAKDSLVTAKERLSRGQGPDLFVTGQLPIATFWTLRDTQLAMEKAGIGLEKSKNDLQKVRDELPKTVITAPFSGLIAAVNAKVDDKISSQEYNSKVIFMLIEPDRFELKATVDEIDVARVAIGQKTVITLDAMLDMELEGTVTYISPLSRTEGGVVFYEVEIGIDGSGSNGLRSGMTAKADIITEKKTDVLLVPDRAIYRNSDGDTVIKIEGDGEARERVISTGISDGILTEVSEGLSETDVVIIERKSSV